MVIVGPQLGESVQVGGQVINKLDEVYLSAQTKLRQLDRESEVAMNKYMDEVTTPKAAMPQEAGSSPASPVAAELPHLQSQPSGAKK